MCLRQHLLFHPFRRHKLEGTTLQNVESEADTLTTGFFDINVLFKDYKDKLRAAAQDHKFSDCHPKRTGPVTKALTSVHSLLNSNMNDLRLKPSIIALTVVGARLAAIKEGLFVAGARLDALEDEHELCGAFIRLEWRQARHKMLCKIYSNPKRADLYERIDISEMTKAVVQIPKTYTQGAPEDQDWPEQWRGIKDDTICAICHLGLKEDPDDDLKGSLAPGLVPSPCCDQPFHTSCVCTYLARDQSIHACPLCRKSWTRSSRLIMIETIIYQWRDVETD